MRLRWLVLPSVLPSMGTMEVVFITLAFVCVCVRSCFDYFGVCVHVYYKHVHMLCGGGWWGRSIDMKLCIHMCMYFTRFSYLSEAMITVSQCLPLL